MAIFDTMRYVKSDVRTVCAGIAASMGAFLLAAGTKVRIVDQYNVIVILYIYIAITIKK